MHFLKQFCMELTFQVVNTSRYMTRLSGRFSVQLKKCTVFSGCQVGLFIMENMYVLYSDRKVCEHLEINLFPAGMCHKM